MRNARQIADSKVDDRVERELEAERFLTTLFGSYDEESEYKFNVWSIRGKSKNNNWNNDPTIASEHAIAQSAEGFDVYTGIALFNRIPLGESRGSRQEAAGFVALVVDIDFPKVGGEIRAKELIRLFEERTGIKPTMIVSSGSGYHVHYCLKEPYTFETGNSDSANDGRALIHNLYTRFIRLYQSIASTITYDDNKVAKIDSTIGVERVWRIPGTLNRKTESKKPCRMILCDETQRINVEDIEQVLPDVQETQSTPVERDPLDIASIVFPYQQWKRLYENNQTFRLLWNRSKRMEQKHGNDDSSYDFALAGIMTRDELHIWGNEEIAAVLQAHRKEHNPQDPKISRIDYYERTIAAVRADNKKTAERTDLISRVHRIAEHETYGIEESGLPSIDDEDIDDTAKFEVISRLLGAAVTAFVKYEAPNNKHSYSMVINGKIVSFPSPDTILSYQKFRQLVFSSINVVLPSKMKLEDWDSIVKTLISSLTIMQATEDETHLGYFRDIVRSYVRDSVKHESPNYGDVMVREGDTYIRIEGLARHMSKRGKNVDTAELIAQIKELTRGNAVRLNVKMFNGNRTTVSVYRIPKEIIEE